VRLHIASGAIVTLLLAVPQPASAQNVPYARSFDQPRPQVEQALKDLQAYTGQKLPLLDGFVAPTEKPLNRYERGFYQFSVELLPGTKNGTVVRLSAKITAWYADRDVTKSGYEVLPSNGRLELDFLDRLQEKLTGKPVDAPATSVQSPQPKLDLSGERTAATMAAPLPQTNQTPDEIATIRSQRIVSEKRVQQLTAELKNLEEIKHSQAHPQNIVVVTEANAPVYAKNVEGARVLFQAALNDEFEFLDADGDWVHVSISGDSRGYMRRSSLQIPEAIAARLQTASPSLETKFPGFRVERTDSSSFPGDWAPLKGKTVTIFTVQVVSENAKDSGPSQRMKYCLALFEKGHSDAVNANPAPEGVVVIFDSADGGIAGATMPSIEKVSTGVLTHDAFWSQSYADPPDMFKASTSGN
jgi:hypothetical protein